ncbi:alpha/beta fold hydrolase [Sulfitobacter sp.]|jgi:pimeloyl-ACP methyl ester carboxylesterase|uniref:alpha/beta fold hydrolase n=1 Tax=unclassified Sulfitobacter TaxID=196795 RepID=UPI0025E30EAF|nr:alpha/beta hydrolase [uncultured Sulfitobacter sp.]
MTAHWTETVELNGHPFFIRHWGDKDAPKLLMLHGFPEYSGAWNDLAPLLATRFHCIAPDQRGYGQSWRPAQVAQYKTSQLVSDMAALIGDEPVILLGHDWGASVAYALTIGRPELVSKLIIMNGVHPAPFQRELAKGGPQTDASQYIHFLRREGSEDILAADGFAKLMGLFSAHMDMDWLQGDTLAGYKAAWRDAAGLRGMVNWYRASPLKLGHTGEAIDDALAFDPARLQVRCPHLLIWGEDDTALMPASTQGLEDYAPDLTRIAIKGADHWLHHQKPREVADAILNWL